MWGLEFGIWRFEVETVNFGGRGVRFDRGLSPSDLRLFEEMYNG